MISIFATCVIQTVWLIDIDIAIVKSCFRFGRQHINIENVVIKIRPPTITLIEIFSLQLRNLDLVLGEIERAAGLPDYWEEEEDEGGDGGHEVKVDQAPPGLEHLEEDLELTGQRVNQDLLLQLILWDCWAIKLYARFLQKTIPDSSSFSWRSYSLLEFCWISNKFLLQMFFLPVETQMIHHLQKTSGSFTQLRNSRIISEN